MITEGEKTQNAQKHSKDLIFFFLKQHRSSVMKLKLQVLRYVDMFNDILANNDQM